jgi:glycosyltransferase involved in cell wall biosynthesis
VNSEIVENGENGFLARDEPEWRDVLIRLLRDENMRKELGASGRARAQERYSLTSQSPRLVDLFKTVAGVTPR